MTYTTYNEKRFLYVKNECMHFDTEDSGSIYTLRYKLGASEFKCEDSCPDSYHTFKLNILNPIGSKDATLLVNIEPRFSFRSHSFTPSFKIGLIVPI